MSQHSYQFITLIRNGCLGTQCLKPITIAISRTTTSVSSLVFRVPELTVLQLKTLTLEDDSNAETEAPHPTLEFKPPTVNLSSNNLNTTSSRDRRGNPVIDTPNARQAPKDVQINTTPFRARHVSVNPAFEVLQALKNVPALCPQGRNGPIPSSDSPHREVYLLQTTNGLCFYWPTLFQAEPFGRDPR